MAEDSTETPLDGGADGVATETPVDGDADGQSELANEIVHSDVGVIRGLELGRRMESIKPYMEFIGILAVLAVPVGVIRVLVVSGYDSEVALTIMSNVEFTSLVVAFLVPAIPATINLVSLVVIADLSTPSRRPRIGKILLLVVMAVYLVPFVRSWLEVVIYYLIPGIYLAVFSYLDRNRDSEVVGRENRRLAFSFFVSSSLALLMSSTMWLPAERLVVDGRAMTAHVLREDDRSFVLFFSDENVVRRYPNDIISERQYCVRDSFLSIRKMKRAGRPICPKQSS